MGEISKEVWSKALSTNVQQIQAETDTVNGLSQSVKASNEALTRTFQTNVKNIQEADVELTNMVKSAVDSTTPFVESIDEALKRTVTSNIQKIQEADIQSGISNIVKSASSSIPAVAPDLSITAPALGDFFSKSGKFGVLLENLRVQEYGFVYVSALALAFATAQHYSSKRNVEEAQKKFDEEMADAKEKAIQAASIAEDAADKVEKAKKIVVKATMGSAEDVLVDSRKMQLELENEMMKKELKDLTVLTEDLKREIRTFTKISAQKAATEPELDVPQTNFVKETLPRDPDEDARILSIVKDIDEKNKKINKVAKKAEVAMAGPEGKSAATTEWSNLSPSALRKKTVKELTEFLSEKGIATTDESGKTLLKKQLLEAVTALQPDIGKEIDEQSKK